MDGRNVLKTDGCNVPADMAITFSLEDSKSQSLSNDRTEANGLKDITGVSTIGMRFLIPRSGAPGKYSKVNPYAIWDDAQGNPQKKQICESMAPDDQREPEGRLILPGRATFSGTKLTFSESILPGSDKNYGTILLKGNLEEGMGEKYTIELQLNWKITKV
ncbi:MAG TPA: hypothetical protein VHY08_01885 [Bacillota bacterium]|nr:hypothetical protein [Bacillota bacterium]